MTTLAAIRPPFLPRCTTMKTGTPDFTWAWVPPVNCTTGTFDGTVMCRWP